MEAQLVLVGGRSSIPNILTILHLKPDVVVTLCSHESKTDFQKIKDVITHYLPDCQVKNLAPVDAFVVDEIAQQCEIAFNRYPQAQWTCNITAATAVMSIAVYKEAELRGYPCWYIDTSHARIVPLVGPAYQQDIFHLSVEQYIAAYYYQLQKSKIDETDAQVLCEQQWLPFAQKLGKNLSLLHSFNEILEIIQNNGPKKDEVKGYSNKKNKHTDTFSPDAYNLLVYAKEIGLVKSITIDNSGITHFQLNNTQHQFLNGTWLEIYVWNELKTIMNLPPDSIDWGYEIITGGTKREADVLLTHKAQLIVAECKTGKNDKKPETLKDLTTLTNPIGAKFVGKILVMSLFTPDKTDEKAYRAHQEFLDKAQQQHIVVTMAEDLPSIGEILAKEVIDPTYKRI